MKITPRNLLYIIVNIIILTISFGIFYIFRPYQFIDHNKTKILCFKNNASYEIGPNLIYILDEKPDPVTEKNIRKLCEYAIINDSQDVLKTPEKVNYALSVSYEKEGNWVDTLFISGITFLLMVVTVNKLFKFNIFQQLAESKLPNLFIVIFALFSFLILLKKPAKHIFCERQMASRVNNFKRSAYGYGLKRIQQEELQMKSILKQVYGKCLKN